MPRRSLAALCMVLAGCDAFPFASIDDFVGDGSADQGAPDQSSEASTDAGADASADAEAGCAPGLISPTQVVNASAASLTGTHVCNVQNASVKDGQFAELEETVDEAVTVLGSSVNACIAAVFPASLATAVVTVKAENTACTTSCSPDGGCNTGHLLVILGGPSTDLLAATYISTPGISSSVSDKPVSFSTDVSVVFVCRNGTQPIRDIPAVDAILGTCK